MQVGYTDQVQKKESIVVPPLSKEGSDYLQLTVLFFIIFIFKDLIDYVNQ